VRQIRGGDADARVPHGEADFVVVSQAQRHLDAAAAGRVLDRVRYEVEKELP
jgi:hypothetical protein